MENKIHHPIAVGIEIKFKHNAFFRQGVITSYVSSTNGYLYTVLVDKDKEYIVRDGEIMGILKNKNNATSDMVNHPAHY